MNRRVHTTEQTYPNRRQQTRGRRQTVSMAKMTPHIQKKVYIPATKPTLVGMLRSPSQCHRVAFPEKSIRGNAIRRSLSFDESDPELNFCGGRLEQIWDRLHLLISEKSHRVVFRSQNRESSCFCVQEVLGLPERRGPLHIGSVHKFCAKLDDHLARSPGHPVVAMTSPASDDIAQTAFVLGAYMILRLGFDQDRVRSQLAALLQPAAALRCDDPPAFHSHPSPNLLDCWDALLRRTSCTTCG